MRIEDRGWRIEHRGWRIQDRERRIEVKIENRGYRINLIPIIFTKILSVSGITLLSGEDLSSFCLITFSLLFSLIY